MTGYRTVSEVFEVPDGPVQLDDRGRWWITRDELAPTSEAQRLTVRLSNGHAQAVIVATPDQLLNFAAAIVAHVESAAANRADPKVAS